MEKIEYGGWPNCYRLSNELVELIATTDVGPRLIRFGFVGEENEFKEFDSMRGQTGGDKWWAYGGHRLWHAPEAQPRTYEPDNAPVQIEPLNDGMHLIQAVESTTGIKKEIEVRLARDEARVEVLHRLRNTSLWTVELAPWALTVMAPGGAAIFPLPPRGTHPQDLLPTSTLTLWAYTDLSDPRWTWGRKYIRLRQDSNLETPQKIGALVSEGWIAYFRDGHLFIKSFDYAPGGHYPDFGCSVETFTDAEMLEIETLGPLVQLEPGAAVEHVERWSLFQDVPALQTEAEVDQYLLSRVPTKT
jgi:hypothetical protein